MASFTPSAPSPSKSSTVTTNLMTCTADLHQALAALDAVAVPGGHRGVVAARAQLLDRLAAADQAGEPVGGAIRLSGPGEAVHVPPLDQAVLHEQGSAQVAVAGLDGTG